MLFWPSACTRCCQTSGLSGICAKTARGAGWLLDDRATCRGQIRSLKDSLRGSAHLAKDDLGELANHHAFLSLPAWEIETFLHDIAQIEQALPGFAGREGSSTRAQAARREIRQAWEGLSNAKVRRAGDHSDNSGPPKAWLAARRHGGRAPFAHKRDSPQPGSWHVLPEMQHTVRFVRGLKGTMSEAELHILRARLRGGILNQAQRAALKLQLGWCMWKMRLSILIPMPRFKTPFGCCLRPSNGQGLPGPL